MKRSISTRADAGTVHVLRSAPDGLELDADARQALLAQVRGNPASTMRLTLVATCYVQGARPNRAALRFRDDALPAICASFVGLPFMRDHAQKDVLARGGTILAADVVPTPDGSKAFQFSIELTKPWAVEGVLDRTIDKFSIGWRATGPVTCTVCGAEYERGFFGGVAPSCAHAPGESYESKGAKVVAQAEFSSAEGIEVSAVSVPAVLGTGVEGIRAALAAGDGAASLQALADAFALGEPGFEVVRTAFEGLHGELATARAGERDARAQLLAFQVDGVVDEALRTGKLMPRSALEGVLRTMAATSLAAAREYVGSLPRITPVGAGLLSSEPASPDPVPAAAIPDEQRRVNAVLGVSDEAWRNRSKSEKENVR